MNYRKSLPSEIVAGYDRLIQGNAAKPSNTHGSKASPIRSPFMDDDEYYIIPVPRVFEQTERGERVFDLYSRLLLDRIVLINREFDDRLANLVTAQLLFLESIDPEKPINIYVNSPGGVISSGMAIYDTMQLVKPEVSTTVIGQAASMGAVILVAGATGKRFALPNSRIMIHQPSGGSQGTSIEVEIHTREMIRVRERLYELLSHHTGKPYEVIVKACDRDRFMTPEEAIEFGMIDKIIMPKKISRLVDKNAANKQLRQ